MSAEQLPPPRTPAEGARLSVGTLLFGALLILIGIVWFVSALDIYAMSFGVVLAIALIVAGAALALDVLPTARGALTAFSVVLVVALSLMTVLDVPFHGGTTSNTITAQAVDQLNASYSYMAGNQTFDLRNLTLPPGETNLAIDLGAGNLTITVPSNVAVQVKYHVGAGNATVFGLEKDGLSVDGTSVPPGYSSAERRLFLDLRVGAGDLEVR